jgi:hypothetical protein
MTRMEETAGARGVDAVEEAMQAAAKHEDRSEALAALVVVARELIEQAQAAEAERVRVAAEAAEAAVKGGGGGFRGCEAASAAGEASGTGVGGAAGAGGSRERHTAAGRGGDIVRGVHGRAQESRGAAVHAHVRV